jgi:hypothetical protein
MRRSCVGVSMQYAARDTSAHVYGALESLENCRNWCGQSELSQYAMLSYQRGQELLMNLDKLSGGYQMGRGYKANNSMRTVFNTLTMSLALGGSKGVVPAMTLTSFSR